MASEGLFRLDGKVALVTGGGLGIGEAICRRLALGGARLAVFDRDRANAERVAAEVRGLPVIGDVTFESDIERALSETHKSLGPIGILVNNAGITGKAAKTWELSRTDMETCSPSTSSARSCCAAR